MNNTAFIISGGPITDAGLLKEKITGNEGRHVICADGGARHCYDAGIVPDLLIGDMDSIKAGIRQFYEERGARFIVHPRDKEKTDTELCLEYALSLKPRAIVIFGATGGRLDHALANISLLKRGVDADVDIRLVDEWCEIFAVGKRVVIDGEKGQTVSVFPLSGKAMGINLEGFAYPLKNGTMEIGRPYGVSNCLSDNQGVISLESGCLVVIHYFKTGGFPET